MLSSQLHVRWAILLTLLVNAASMLTPIINEGDSVIYAALSQHMVATGNWSDLVLSGADWLDKPHFPFWATAASFSLFGISAASYILPGFLFHLLGGYFTYRLARTLYDRSTAVLALLVYVSVFHLMYTSSVIKAEAFLTGSITAAVYYWVRFDTTGRAKHLLLGALFTAISVMTKGIFTMITIASGLVCMWLLQRRWRLLWSLKWWLAAAVSVLFLAPEVLSLYRQFDMQPDKVVFGQTGVSGIRFFLWDSQFGRFFNSGPIKNEQGDPMYFVHVFLWAFLPWVAVYLMATVQAMRNLRTMEKRHRDAWVLLAGTFFVTFALFSATSFQLDYYTVILFPFAANVCADYLQRWLSGPAAGRGLVFAQWAMTAVVFALALVMALYVARSELVLLVLAAGVAAMGYFWWQRSHARVIAVLILPVIAVNILYVFLDLMTFGAYARYSVPYNVTPLLEAHRDVPVVVYRMDYIVPLELALYSGNPTVGVASAQELERWVRGRSARVKEEPAKRAGDTEQTGPAPSAVATPDVPYILLVRDTDLSGLDPQLQSATRIGSGAWVDHKTGILPRMLRLAKGVEPLDKMHVLKVRGT